MNFWLQEYKLQTIWYYYLLMRSNGQNTEIKNPAALQQNSTPALELGDRGRGGGGCGYSGKITTARCVDFWGGDIVWDPWTLRQSAILWWFLGGQIDLLQRQQLLSFLGLGLTQCFFFSVIIIPKYCQSSQNQPYWESIKAVATRAAGHLREWDLISNHVINLWLLSAIAHESFSLQSLRHSSKRVLQCWQ